MEYSDKILMQASQFVNEETGEKADGINILINGRLKELFDFIIEKEGKADYFQVMNELMFLGAEEILKKYR